MTLLKATLRKIAPVAATIFAGLIASPSWANIAASGTFSGPPHALNFVASVSIDRAFLGAKLYLVMQHGPNVFLLTRDRGFVLYTGDEIPEYKTINQTEDIIPLLNWNVSALPGAAIHVGYGVDGWDMINNGRYKTVNITPPSDGPLPTVPNPYSANSGDYRCIDRYNTPMPGPVGAWINADTAVVDTSRLPGTQSTHYNVRFGPKIGVTAREPEPARAYHNGAGTYPQKIVLVDPTLQGNYPLVIIYQREIYGTTTIYWCKK